jgi:hypothetical protein
VSVRPSSDIVVGRRVAVAVVCGEAIHVLPDIVVGRRVAVAVVCGEAIHVLPDEEDVPGVVVVR